MGYKSVTISEARYIGYKPITALSETNLIGYTSITLLSEVRLVNKTLWELRLLPNSCHWLLFQ
jgi:hypothetical protein